MMMNKAYIYVVRALMYINFRFSFISPTKYVVQQLSQFTLMFSVNDSAAKQNPAEHMCKVDQTDELANIDKTNADVKYR